MLNSEQNVQECDPPLLRCGRAGATGDDSSTAAGTIIIMNLELRIMNGKQIMNAELRMTAKPFIILNS